MLMGPEGFFEMDEGVIRALRHVHMNPEDAAYYGVKRGRQDETARLAGECGADLGGFGRPRGQGFKLEVHIDTDEGNACDLRPDSKVRIVEVKIGRLSDRSNHRRNMSEALGMIETKGYVGSVEASDAMVKAANVTPGQDHPDRRRIDHRPVQGRCRQRQSRGGRRRRAAAGKVGELVVQPRHAASPGEAPKPNSK